MRPFPQFKLVLATSLLSASAGVGQERESARPVEEYLLPESEEVALALSAGPPSVTGDAGVMVLRPDGYQWVRESSNGFTCLVQRGWSSPLVPEVNPDFFLPRLLAPICFNPSATRTIMVEYLRRTELALAGKTAEEMRSILLEEIGSGALVPPIVPAIAYMLSPAQWIGTPVGRWHPHVMLYLPFADATTVGTHAIESGLPLPFDYMGGPFAAFVLEVKHWAEDPDLSPAQRP